MKKQLLSVILGLSLVTFGAQAQNHGKMDHNSEQAEITMSHDAPKEFQEQLAGVYAASLDLKEAFVSSEAAQVREALSPVQEALSKVDMKLLKDQAHMAWMNQLKTLNGNLEAISDTSAIDVQREGFANFSQALYQSIKSFGISGGEAYYQYCPMANDNQGAYWLSDSKEIRNPYFGDKMLTCGSVKEALN